MKPLHLIITADGSHTIQIGDTDLSYHSVHGSIQESKTVFITAGLHYVVKNKINSPIRVLEIGFGSGLNAIMTLMEAENLSYNIHYDTIEAFPIDIEMVKALNYTEQLKLTKTQELSFIAMHSLEDNKNLDLNNFKFRKHITTFEAIKLESNYYDVIYFDAFSPNAQPELWTLDIFSKMYDCLVQDGVLTTYCAKGQVKRTMKAAGFTLQSLPGPIGKREMTRAHK